MGELDKALDEYRGRFKDNFPMYQLGRGRSDEEIVAIIDVCIREGKDVYEKGFLPPVSSGIIY